jgi:hypothetical protein
MPVLIVNISFPITMKLTSHSCLLCGLNSEFPSTSNSNHVNEKYFILFQSPLQEVAIKWAVYCLSLMWLDIITDSANSSTQFYTSINPIISINCATIVSTFANEQLRLLIIATGWKTNTNTCNTVAACGRSVSSTICCASEQIFARMDT